jgi:hypothetical protein
MVAARRVIALPTDAAGQRQRLLEISRSRTEPTSRVERLKTKDAAPLTQRFGHSPGTRPISNLTEEIRVIALQTVERIGATVTLLGLNNDIVILFFGWSPSVRGDRLAPHR